MKIYFEQITLGNLIPALISSIRGHRVMYFTPGRFLRKIPLLRTFVLKQFQKADNHPAYHEGLIFEINSFALEAAEKVHSQLVDQNKRATAQWRKSLRTERIDLYIKKYLAMNALPLGRAYLLMRRLAQESDHSSELVVLDKPINRILVPLITLLYPEVSIKVKGLSRPPWRIVNDSLLALLFSAEYVVRLAEMFCRRKFTLLKTPRQAKVLKELIWGLGTGRRNDDFFVDGSLIARDDVLFYYRRDSRERMSSNDLLEVFLENAKEMGYECVNFERTPIPLPMVWRVYLLRYFWFPLSIFFSALLNQVAHPSAGVLNAIITGFLTYTSEWEAFLGTHTPRLSLSLDDPYLRHNAETIALNLHGAQNVGYQWSDDATFRDPLLAYLGYNVYFAWGNSAEKYWEGNWGVDQMVLTGYLWGHHFLESLEKREESRKALFGANQNHRLVLSLLDEKIDELHISGEDLYNFYSVATKLLERRTDVVVVVKPKRAAGVRDIPNVMELLAPHIESGRLAMWDHMISDVQEVIAISDVVISFWMGVPYLEAICCGKQGFNYDPANHHGSPIYAKAYGKIVFDDVDSVVEAIDHALDHPDEKPWANISNLIDEVDPYRDFKGIDRMRQYIYKMCD